MNRRDWLLMIGALSIPFPVEKVLARKSKPCHLIGLGDCGSRVAREVRAQLGDSFFGQDVDSNEILVVFSLTDRNAQGALRSLGRERRRDQTIVCYCLDNLLPENASHEAFLTRRGSNMLVFDVAQKIRVFSPMDYLPNAPTPRWPMEWIDQDLSPEEKQAVWELLCRSKLSKN